jgi:FMN phosphatase YigB (HAD superfamily)
LATGKSPRLPPKAVIFDIGRVIVQLNPERAFAKLASQSIKSNVSGETPDLPHEFIWTAIQADPCWREWQEGRITPQRWYEHVTSQLSVAMSFEDFCATWNSLLEPQTILSDHFFEQLGRRCRLGLLSNTDPIHREHLENHFSFLRHFPARIYSDEVGASKPSREMYEAALLGLDVAPAEALYIDDIAEYAGAARQIGLDAIHFKNPQQLAREFIRRGLPPPI